MLISDPPPTDPAVAPAGPWADRSAHVLTMSARVARPPCARWPTPPPARWWTLVRPALADAAFTLNIGRNAFGHRLAVVAASNDEAATALSRFAADEATPDVVARDLGTMTAPKPAFLFTGQGSQYAGMGAELHREEPAFRDALDRCDAVLREHLDRPLLTVLHPAPGEPSPIDDTTYTQPALFALEYALATMWQSWGVRPALMLGHSIGSYVAAHLAGVMSLEDALALVAARGRLMGSLPAGGSMASVFAAEDTVAAAVGGHRWTGLDRGHQRPGQHRDLGAGRAGPRQQSKRWPRTASRPAR